jgi:hypothetical protein
MQTTVTFVTLGTLALISVANADVLHLKNGSTVVGELLSAEANTLVFETPFAGKLTVQQANVVRIMTDEPVNIMLKDGSVYRDRQIDVKDEVLVAIAEDEDSVNFAAMDIAMINPEPWRLGEGYNWTGDFNASIKTERGNSDLDEWDFAGKTAWRSLKDRYQVDAEIEYDKSNTVETKDQWKIRGKYDRFFSSGSDNYYGAKLRFEHDQFADLDLRTIVGPHIGRQFFESKLFALHAELGPAWIDERFEQAEGDDYPGALWEVEITSDIIGFGTQVYVVHDGILNFDATGDPILNTRIGIKMPLIFGLQSGIEAKYEYDGGAVEDVDTTDETYSFFIGYKW